MNPTTIKLIAAVLVFGALFALGYTMANVVLGFIGL